MVHEAGNIVNVYICNSNVVLIMTYHIWGVRRFILLKALQCLTRKRTVLKWNVARVGAPNPEQLIRRMCQGVDEFIGRRPRGWWVFWEWQVYLKAYRIYLDEDDEQKVCVNRQSMHNRRSRPRKEQKQLLTIPNNGSIPKLLISSI